jgi:hypothetical protein
VYTLLSYRYPELFDVYLVDESGLIGPFFDALHQGRLAELRQPVPAGRTVGRTERARVARPLARPLDEIGLYVQGFNAPEQFRAWLDSARAAAPALLDTTHKVLLNNSNDTTLFAAYDALCAEHGFTQYRLGNLGTTGGRAWCARHFEEQTAWDAMLYFEDDMLLHTSLGLCQNGFRTVVPSLLDSVREIVRAEGVDFLKLSFSEVCGDHTQNWAYYNLGEDERRHDFPDGPTARFDAIKSHQGLTYALGDVFYSNWPMLITRRGSRAIFLDDPDVPRYEQLLMAHAHRLNRAGALRSGVLMASPIRHHRLQPYPLEERREC